MPRIELPRPRAFFCGRLPERRLERFLAGLYIFSSAAFLVGSIFFLPEFAGEPPEFSPEYEAGCWLYQLGSVGFMTVSAFDFEEARRNKSPFSPYVAKMLGASFDRVLAGLYLAGMSGFVIGCVFFFPVNENDLGEASNDAGSGIFVLSNLVLITASFINGAFAGASTESSTVDAVLAVLRSNAAMLGCVLFLVASVLFLPQAACDSNGTVAVWLFIIGSVFFTLAGVGQYIGACRPRRRTAALSKEDAAQTPSGVELRVAAADAPSPAPRETAPV